MTMKISPLEVDKVREIIDDTKEGQRTSYVLKMKGQDYTVVVTGPEPFRGFQAGQAVSVAITNPQTTL